MEPAAAQPADRAHANPRGKATTKTYVLLFIAWAALVAGGMWGAKMYTDHLRTQIASDIAKQTGEQLAAVKAQYEAELAQLKESIGADMTQMQTKIDSVGELLAFTKDSANEKTDNSNQLYTQLAEVKKQLDDLKKDLDALQ